VRARVTETQNNKEFGQAPNNKPGALRVCPELIALVAGSFEGSAHSRAHQPNPCRRVPLSDTGSAPPVRQFRTDAIVLHQGKREFFFLNTFSAGWTWEGRSEYP
jgi:hypothetical protein